MTMKIPKITFWKAVLVLILIPGLYSLIYRLTHGLGQSTNLNDEFPWGLWVGFKLFSVALAGGGFTLAAVVYIFNLKAYRPILRAMILTAFLGYSMFIASLILDLGRPFRIWHPIVMWNHHSVMFEIAWCVMLYTTVLVLEFLPVILEHFGLHRQLAWLHNIMIPLVIAGVVLSTLHQSSLGSLYLIVPEKLYPLWYSPLEPVFFFISAIAAGLAMAIFESWHADKAFHQRLQISLLTGLGRVLAVVLSFYLSLRLVDLIRRGQVHLLWQRRSETYLFYLEIALLQAPMVLLFKRRVLTSRTWLYLCSVLTLLGFVTNRMNVAITGMLAASGHNYFPKWTEISITLAIIAAGFLVFALAVKYLPILPNGRAYDPTSEPRMPRAPAILPELSHATT